MRASRKSYYKTISSSESLAINTQLRIKIDIYFWINGNSSEDNWAIFFNTLFSNNIANESAVPAILLRPNNELVITYFYIDLKL